MSSVELADPPGERVIVCGLSETTRPLFEREYVRVTAPEKPFSPVIAIVELPEKPAWKESEDGLLVSEKSVTTTVTCVERTIVPLVEFPVPVTVIVYVPGETVDFVRTVSVEEADPEDGRVTEVRLRLAPGPPEVLDTRLTVPANPSALVKVTVAVPEDPAGIVSELGLVEIEKVGAALTTTRTVVE